MKFLYLNNFQEFLYLVILDIQILQIMKKNYKLEEDIKLCTECGKDLTNFDFSGKSEDEVNLNYEICKHTGKFNGDLCSKKFILDDDFEDKMADPDDDF